MEFSYGSIRIEATKSPNVPLDTSRSITTTRPSDCNPTTARVPFLLTENCLGKRPPAEASCLKVSFPVPWSIAQTWRVSDGILVLFVGSKLGISKVETLRHEVRRNLWSGYLLLVTNSLREEKEKNIQRGRSLLQQLPRVLALGHKPHWKIQVRNSKSPLHK
jgi:hypothetical protein